GRWDWKAERCTPSQAGSPGGEGRPAEFEIQPYASLGSGSAGRAVCRGRVAPWGGLGTPFGSVDTRCQRSTGEGSRPTSALVSSGVNIVGTFWPKVNRRLSAEGEYATYCGVHTLFIKM